jgi:hypothetical protein
MGRPRPQARAAGGRRAARGRGCGCWPTRGQADSDILTGAQHRGMQPVVPSRRGLRCCSRFYLGLTLRPEDPAGTPALSQKYSRPSALTPKVATHAPRHPSGATFQRLCSGRVRWNHIISRASGCRHQINTDVFTVGSVPARPIPACLAAGKHCDVQTVWAPRALLLWTPTRAARHPALASRVAPMASAAPARACALVAGAAPTVPARPGRRRRPLPAPCRALASAAAWWASARAQAATTSTGSTRKLGQSRCPLGGPVVGPGVREVTGRPAPRHASPSRPAWGTRTMYTPEAVAAVFTDLGWPGGVHWVH